MDVIKVISLQNAIKRRQHIQRTFGQLNIKYEFFNAIHKENLASCLENYKLNFEEGCLTDGEKACFLSHYVLWQQVVESNLNYLVICEDDVILSHKVSSLLEVLPRIMFDCDILKFETMLRPVVINDQCHIDYQQFVLKQLRTENMGTAGYVISKNMALYLIEFFKKTKINQPIDHYLFLDFLKTDKKIYQTVPAFAIQDDILNVNNVTLCSDLQAERRKKLDKNTLHHNKLVRELLRLFQPLNRKYRKEKLYRQYIKKYGQIIEFSE